MKLSISLATRGRPELLSATIATTLENIVRPDTSIVVALDADDEPSITAAKAFEPRVIVSVEPRPDTIAEKWNRVLRIAPADVYLTMVDHAPHTTRGFDQKILDAAALFPDGIGVVYNHLANLTFSQINGVTAGLARLMGGKIYPELFPYWFVDHWLDDIARTIGRVAFADVWQTPIVKPATQEMREPAFWGTFYDALAPMRRDIAHRIIAAAEFDEPEWRKRLLLTAYPLVEERSAMVNNRVRGLTWNKALDLQDPRYVRVKERAVALLKGMLVREAA